jgi:hypothetical protein
MKKTKVVTVEDVQAIVVGSRVHYWSEGPLTVAQVSHRTDPFTGNVMAYGMAVTEGRNPRMFALVAGEHYTPGFGVTP